MINLNDIVITCGDANDGFEVRRAKYAKDKFAICTFNGGSQYKKRAERLCSVLNLRYTNRERSYIASASQIQKLYKMWQADHDGVLGDKNGRFGFILTPR